MTASEILARIDALPVRNTPAIRRVRRAISKELAQAPRADVLALAYELILLAPARRWVAYELVQHHASAAQRIALSEVERLGDGMADWASVDTFSCYIAGPAWRAGQIANASVHRWAKSNDRWWRRAALVSTVPLNVRAQGGTGDAPRTIEVCDLLAGDRDEMVVKALSWALRALVPHHRTAVIRFLSRRDGDLAALVKREVRNKLATGRKSGNDH